LLAVDGRLKAEVEISQRLLNWEVSESFEFTSSRYASGVAAF
jgi:hypothetical protein